MPIAIQAGWPDTIHRHEPVENQVYMIAHEMHPTIANTANTANTACDPHALEPVAKTSWILDLDMFTTQSLSFASEQLPTTAMGFAVSAVTAMGHVARDRQPCLYWRRP